MFAWGNDFSSQLGNGFPETDESSPVQVSNQSDFVQIACGRSTSYALKPDGVLWVWGAGNNGAHGLGDTTRRFVPTEVMSQSDFSQIYSGDNFSVIALKTDGTVWAWGRNDDGQLGDNTTTDKSSPIQVLGGVYNVSSPDNNRQQTKQFVLNVTPGDVYSYQTGAYGFFGRGTNIFLDKEVGQFELEYLS